MPGLTLLQLASVNVPAGAVLVVFSGVAAKSIGEAIANARAQNNLHGNAGVPGRGDIQTHENSRTFAAPMLLPRRRAQGRKPSAGLLTSASNSLALVCID